MSDRSRNAVRWLPLGLIVAASWSSAVLLLPHLRFDFSSESLLPVDDPARVVHERFLETFGSDLFAIVMFEAPKGSIFSGEFLDDLSRLHSELSERVPHTNRIDSLWNARHTEAKDGQLRVSELGDRWPSSDHELRQFEDTVRSNPLYRGNLVGLDYRSAAVVLELSSWSESTGPSDLLEPGEGAAHAVTPEEEARFAVSVLEVAGEFEKAGHRIHVAGAPIIQHLMAAEQSQDAGMFALAAFVIIGALLFCFFRSLIATVVPLILVVHCTVLSLSLMPLLGLSFTSLTQLVPNFLLVIGIAGSTHLIGRTLREQVSGLDALEAAAVARRSCTFPVLFAGLTTALGFCSLIVAPLDPMRGLGVATALGVVLTTLATLAGLLPLLPLIRPRAGSKRAIEASARAMTVCGRWATRNARPLCGLLVATVVVSWLGILRLGTSHDPVSWYPVDHPVRMAVERIDRNLGGMLPLEVLVDTGEAEQIKAPNVVRALRDLGDDALALEAGRVRVQTAVSIADVIEEVHLALVPETTRDEYTVPSTRELIAQELLLFELGGGSDLDRFADSTFRTARMSLRVPAADGAELKAYIDKLAAVAQERTEGLGKVELTGSVMLELTSFLKLGPGLLDSYLLALGLVCPALLAAIGRMREGAIAIIPNAVPFLALFGMMGWLGIPITISTALVGGIVIGISVDDTVHFFRGLAAAKAGDSEARVDAVMRHAGPGILLSTIVLSVGFFVFAASSFSNIRDMGLVLGSGIAMAFASDVFFGPALVALWPEKRRAETQT